MRILKLRTLFICLGLVLILNNVGFCLFRDDVDPQQVRARLSIQRKKDEQRKTMHQIRQEQEENINKQNVQSQGEDIKVKAENPIQEISGQTQQDKQVSELPSQTDVNFKRLKRDDAMIVAKQQTKPQTQTAVPASREKKQSFNKGWILLIVVLSVGFFMVRKKEK